MIGEFIIELQKEVTKSAGRNRGNQHACRAWRGKGADLDGRLEHPKLFLIS
jgi:hypothetical protein